jgi:ComF family protein
VVTSPLPFLLGLLWPPRCGGCDALGQLYCAGCRGALQRLEPPLCPRCGIELEHAGSCGCRRRLRSLSSLRSAAVYGGPLERLLQRFKYEGRRSLAQPLGHLLAESLILDGVVADAVTCVPLHPRRRRRRGYNQAELLAREVARLTHLPFLDGLVRELDTPPQVGLDRRRRLENVREAFAWQAQDLGRCSVLLIDDVATTGATLDACAAALKRARSGPVAGLTVARVRV